jgi:hypothetical protein
MRLRYPKDSATAASHEPLMPRHLKRNTAAAVRTIKIAVRQNTLNKPKHAW